LTAKRKKRRERKLRQHRADPKRFWAPPGALQEVEEPDRLAYSRKQAAGALGVSISTIDRRVVPSLNTVKTPWGQRLIPAAELERFLHEHVEPPREPGERGRAGRPPTVPRPVVERIRLQYARGHGLAEIARAPKRRRRPLRARRPTVVALDGQGRRRPLEPAHVRRSERASGLISHLRSSDASVNSPHRLSQVASPLQSRHISMIPERTAVLTRAHVVVALKTITR
jgi:hypothetical protein